MNLSNLIEKQRELLEHIVTEKQLLEGNLIKDTFLALQVELAEFANEGRWFKYWSNDQEPRGSVFSNCDDEEAEYFICGECHREFSIEDAENKDYECTECFNALMGMKERNPLLEEYVDSFHFFLQIAILMGWEDALLIYPEQLDPEEFDGDLSGWYLEMTYFLNKSYFENPSEEQSQKWEKHFGFTKKQYYFRTAWILFLNLGMNGFGFTWNQICDAYLDKNKVNHARQENGY